ncbi:MAG: recombinase family protein [Candidatus Omnitrophota bacterium]
MRCAIYTRVSTDNQAEVEFNSCEAQESKINSFIKSQENMKVFRVYSDAGFTGANVNRPAMQEMLHDIKDGKIDLVISYKIDRLTRSPKDFYALVELFDSHNVDFISVTERFDTSTPSGRLLRNIMLTFAQFERELTSERTKDKLLERAQKGMWNGGFVPFGYKAIDKKLVVDQKEASIVKDIFENYVTTQSVARICSELKTRDINHLSKNRIYTLLKNPIYTGKIKYADKVSQGNHEPIISQKIFDLAQKIPGKRVRKLRVYKHFALAGLIRCKECGSTMTPCHTNKYKKGKMERYYYYRCTSTFKKDWDKCATKQVNATRLEDYIFQNLERISQDKHYLDSLIFKLKYSAPGDRMGLEPSEGCSDPSTISAEIFKQTLEELVKNLGSKKGLEKNLSAKKYIKKIEYSPEEISISLYYKITLPEQELDMMASGRVGATACLSSSSGQKKSPRVTPEGLRLAPHSRVAQTIEVILQNKSHGCKKKNIHAQRRVAKMRS